MQFLEADVDRFRIVIVGDVKTVSGLTILAVRHKQRPASNDTQTCQRHVLGVVGQDQYVAGHFLHVLGTHTDTHTNKLRTMYAVSRKKTSGYECDDK